MFIICLLKVVYEWLSSSTLHFESRVWNEIFEDCLEFCVNLLVNSVLIANRGKDVGMFRVKHIQVHLFEFLDFRSHKLVEVTSHTCVEDACLLFDGHWHELLLLEQFSELFSSVKKLLGGGIKIGTELGESGDLTILSQLELHGTGDLLHGLGLGSGADTGHRETDVDGGSDTWRTD